MPRYFFNVGVPGEAVHDDSAGTVFRRDGDALDYASRIIRELKQAGGYDAPGTRMTVKDHTQREVFSIPFEAAANCGL